MPLLFKYSFPYISIFNIFSSFHPLTHVLLRIILIKKEEIYAAYPKRNHQTAQKTWLIKMEEIS